MTIRNENNFSELIQLKNIKNNFVKNYDNYIRNIDDNNFKETLKEIKIVSQEKDIVNILNTIKKNFTDVQSKFFFDDSINY